MQRFKKVALLLSALFALAAFPAVASAGEGEIEIDEGGSPCLIEYDYTGGIPGSGDIENITSDGCEYEGLPISIRSTSDVTATLTGTSSSGTISISGLVHARILGFVNCYYLITTPATGTYSGGTFTATGGAASTAPSPPYPASSGLCPSPLSPISITGTLP